MKLSGTLEKALNEQMNLELASAYVYLGMAAHLVQTPFIGFTKWMQIQSKEELGHADKFFEYIAVRGGKPILQAIPQPKCEYASVLKVFETSLAHEQKVSTAISKVYEAAQAEKDYPTVSFLKWFLDEQVEEEKNVNDMVARLKLIGESTNGLFQLDHIAGHRGEK